MTTTNFRRLVRRLVVEALRGVNANDPKLGDDVYEDLVVSAGKIIKALTDAGIPSKSIPFLEIDPKDVYREKVDGINVLVNQRNFGEALEWKVVIQVDQYASNRDIFRVLSDIFGNARPGPTTGRDRKTYITRKSSRVYAFGALITLTSPTMDDLSSDDAQVVLLHPARVAWMN